MQVENFTFGDLCESREYCLKSRRPVSTVGQAMAQRTKIIISLLVVLVTLWVGWHLLAWTTRGLSRLVKHEQTVYAKWKLKREVRKMEPWTASTNYSAAGWKQLVETAKAFQGVTPKVAAETLSEHLQRYAGKPELFAEQGKVFLLLRAIFELPENASAGQRLTFAGWTQGRSDLNQDGSANLSWPLSWSQGKPQLVAGCEGAAGNYPAGDEFAFMRYKFKYRELSKVTW